jgi:very-short-patch-repair endonuclease
MPQHDWKKARELRRTMSLPEGLLWRELRGKPEGLKFRRQHPVGPYVIDFYCPSAKTGFEIDGIAHDMGNRPGTDPQRDAWLSNQGIRIIRIAASEVLADPEKIAAAIVAHCIDCEK